MENYSRIKLRGGNERSGDSGITAWYPSTHSAEINTLIIRLKVFVLSQ